MTQQEIESFARNALHSLYDLAPLGIESETAVAGVLSEIRDLLYLNSPEVLIDRCLHFAVPGVTELDYQEKFYDLAPGKTVLAGIRHLNASASRPFVSLYLGFSPEHSDLAAIQNFAQENFARFSPLHVSVWLKPSSILTQELEKEIIPSRQYLVARVAHLLSLPSPENTGKIRLQRLSGNIDYEWYLQAYQEFHQQNPALQSWVPATEKEELEKCAQEGLLFEVEIEGGRAGLIGARAEPLLGVPAVYMTELLLTGDFKKRGLAVSLQRCFIETLGPEFQLIWGTIDAKNLPSKKTALRVGRIPVRSEYFIPLKN